LHDVIVGLATTSSILCGSPAVVNRFYAKKVAVFEKAVSAIAK
jgi:hypothetical protein